MAKLFGRSYTRKELLQNIGSISQVGGTRLIELADGNEKGVLAIEFGTGTGFNFTVLADRGMDVSSAAHCGRSLCWRSATGDVAPTFYEPEGLGWLRGFFGGLVCTCGMTYAGAPCADGKSELGLHGRISNLPAKNVSHGGRWVGNEYEMFAEGTMREAVLFGENLTLTRRISARLGESRFFIHDVVTNEGYSKSPLMFLYHINGGWPAVADGSELISPTLSATPRDDEAVAGSEHYNTFQAPTRGFKEKCYYHDMATSGGIVHAALINRKVDDGFGFYVKYSKRELPFFTEWKMMGQGEYVVGVEPANCRVEGRDKSRERGELQFIKPGETREFRVEIGVVSGKADVAAIEEAVKATLRKKN